MSQQTSQKYKAKIFRVATEGATTDGRNIERAWIQEMADSYDPKKYGARIWMEHLRGYTPDSTFRAYGDVLSLSTKEVDGKLALFAEIAPLPDLVAMTTKAKQKIYTSIEVTPKFADTGKAYLTGLAVTDTPASLGTEVLEFAAQKPEANPFKGRKSHADALFSVAVEQEMSFEPEASDDSAKKFTDRIKDLVAKFSGKARSDDERFGAVEEGFTAVTEQFTKHADAIAKVEKASADNTTELEKFRGELAEVRKHLDNTDANKHSQRPSATGGNGQQLTDC
jgi:hypothetical protein